MTDIGQTQRSQSLLSVHLLSVDSPDGVMNTGNVN